MKVSYYPGCSLEGTAADYAASITAVTPLLNLELAELEDWKHLVSGEASAPWIEEESLRLISMMEPSVGATLQSGGAMIDDIYGQYPELGWERLVKEFLRSPA